MQNFFKKYTSYSPSVLRIGISLIILWFGFTQLFNPEWGLSWLPSWTQAIPLEPLTIITLNGIAEIILGILLLTGFLIRISSGLLILHLLTIVIFGIGYNDVAIRDIGIIFALVAVFLHGKDKLCIKK